MWRWYENHFFLKYFMNFPMCTSHLDGSLESSHLDSKYAKSSYKNLDAPYNTLTSQFSSLSNYKMC